MRYIGIFSRYFVALVFIFSGFVKVIDPLGSTYKFTDYFQDAFGLEWMVPASFILAFVMSVVEFVLGIVLLLNVRVRNASWGVLLFMILFTPLTFYLALYNPVQDCGCFGDALILSNWQTFYKNLIILLFVLILFSYRKKYKTWIRPKGEWVVTGFFFAATIALSMYCYMHLPLMDFRPYKVGTYLPEKMVIPEGFPTDEYKYIYSMHNTETGEKIDIDSKEYVENTKYWDEGTKWEITGTSEPILVKKGYTPPIHDFKIYSPDGSEVTDMVLSDDRYFFLLVSYNVNKASVKNQIQINQLAEYCLANDIGFICLTSSLDEDIKSYTEKNKVPYEFYSMDEITLKTIIRANPGLVLLKRGTVMGKWHNNDIPEIEYFEKTFFKR